MCDTDVTFAICNVCKEKISRGGSKVKNFNTTNLIRHLKNHHSAQHGEFAKLTAENEKKKGEKTPQRLLTQPTLESTHAYSRDSGKAKAITKKVMEFIALDDQPFSVVEDVGFRRLLAHIDPRYTLPSRRHLVDVALPELHQAVHSHIDGLLKENVSSFSFTSDIWSSDVSPVSMLSLTAQWIDADFHLRNVILHSQEFPGSHTAAALVTAYENMFQTWNIPKEKVHVILRDNARNMVKAMKDAGWQSLGCMAHTLQLAVHEGVLSQRSISDIAAIGRRIVGHFKHSPLAYSRLQNVQKDLFQTPKRLQQDVATRWNSTYYMLKSLLEQKRALSAYVADFDLPDTFSANQWGLIENMLSLLEPFEELTQKISKASTSAADGIPSVMALKRFLGKEVATDHGVKTSKATLLEAVTRRFAEMEKEPLYSLATIIDPR